MLTTPTRTPQELREIREKLSKKSKWLLTDLKVAKVRIDEPVKTKLVHDPEAAKRVKMFLSKKPERPPKLKKKKKRELVFY